MFNWTPRHLNATNVKYKFTLTELWDEGIDPQTFARSPPQTKLQNALITFHELPSKGFFCLVQPLKK